MTTIRQLAKAAIEGVDPSFKIVWRKRGSPTNLFTWDGSGVLRMSETEELLAIHDVAHVLIAPEHRLKVPEWGLGGDPSGLYGGELNAEKYVKMSSTAAQAEENVVCDVHWALGSYVGGRKAGDVIIEYLSTRTPPSHQRISAMRRFKGLPKDFVPKVLAVRREYCRGCAQTPEFCQCEIQAQVAQMERARTELASGELLLLRSQQPVLERSSCS